MAYFRCGGGGIPSSLKTDMNTVYNKKFGTSTTYDPSVWASTANLMGPLPERTATGSIAHITDGADEVPIKSWDVEIAPTLTGKSAIEATQTGKNLFNLDRTEGTPDPTDIIISPRILDITKLFKGLRADNYFYAGYASYSISGGVLSVTTSNNLNYGIAFPVRVKGGASYCLSAILTGANMSVGCYDKNWNFINRIFGMVSDASRSFSTPSNAEYITVVFGSSTLNVEGTVSNIQLEVGSTATTYEPYTAPTVSTVNLGRTIYGGTADIVNGTGSEKYKLYTASDVTSLYWDAKKAEQVDTNHRASFRIALSSGYITVNNSLCNELSYSINIASGSGAYEGYQIIATAGIYFCIDLSDIGMENATSSTPDEDFLAAIRNYGDNLKFVVELSTPTDFTFTPITPTPETALGVNNFWADEGDTEVTYRADINLALGGQ